MTVYVRTAPSTPVPGQALSGKHKTHSVAAPVTVQAGPDWSQLTTPQKEALYPLANRWTYLSEAQKRNWLRLAASFHSLAPHEQAKMLDRITEWASLSAQQRSQARLNYAAAAKLPADSKRAQWEAYQALSPEEKKRLAAKAAPKPAGAAIAVRPVSPKKLARVPAAVNATPAVPNPPKILPPPEFHSPQALPVTPLPPPVVVETAPVTMPSAVAVPLPPIAPASEVEQAPPPADQAPLYTPS